MSTPQKPDTVSDEPGRGDGDKLDALPDGCPGKGEAALVAAFMQAAAINMAGKVIARSIEFVGSN